MTPTPCRLSRPGIVSALGTGIETTRDGLMAGDTRGMVLENGLLAHVPARVGRVTATLPEIPVNAKLAARSRNNRMLLAAIAQIADDIDAAVRRYGPHRIAIVLGTSTSGVAEGEAAIAGHTTSGALPSNFDYGQMEIGAPAPFLAAHLGIFGPAYTVSTACTSGAKALASARNLLATGLVDAVIAGGVDTLCRLTVNGFTALESTSADLNNPLSRHRRGINIGEGAAVFIVTRDDGPVTLLGIGESSDAHHMSAPDPMIENGAMGIAYGSSSGSIEPVEVFGRMMSTGSMQGVTSTTYIQMMPHTTAVNTALFFGLKGRVIPTSSACTSGSQAIGYAYEAIRWGRQTMMLAGGAEELSAASAVVFDTLFATSTKNDTPTLTPRPFDAERDGLVVGEGAATLVLEEYEHAVARGANILAEIVGFGSNADGAHITQPEAETMAVAMKLALKDANLSPEAIGYISAHGTATDRGDIAESRATAEVLGSCTPISSMKSYLGHTLGACGAIEAWWAIEMMRRNWFAPTVNLLTPDSACAALDHVTGNGRALDTEYVMSNNFAFGGINTSLIFRKI